MGWVSSFQGFCQINFAPRLFSHSGILKIRKLRSGQVRPNHPCLAHSTDDPPPVPMSRMSQMSQLLALRQVSCNGGYSENHPVDTRLGEGLNMHGLSPMSQLSTKLVNYCRSNTPIHVAAAPQIVLLDKFVCVLRARQRTQNTQKLILQLVVAVGDPPVREMAPTISHAPSLVSGGENCDNHAPPFEMLHTPLSLASPRTLAPASPVF